PRRRLKSFKECIYIAMKLIINWDIFAIKIRSNNSKFRVSSFIYSIKNQLLIPADEGINTVPACLGETNPDKND
ncbi:MAG: hypothetical protein ACM3S2_14950, partial [Ignavibacteriales bacterium]